jgi:large conductance mechanosensitive channel
MRKMLAEFREFAVRGNVVDMAVGIVIGGGLATIAKSLVEDVLMPPIGLVLGDTGLVDAFVVLRDGAAAGPYESLAVAREAGAITLNYGSLIGATISFVLVALAAFVLVRFINRLRRRQKDGDSPPVDPATRQCSECLSEVPKKARRCAYCTSALSPASEATAL